MSSTMDWNSDANVNFSRRHRVHGDLGAQPFAEPLRNSREELRRHVGRTRQVEQMALEPSMDSSSMPDVVGTRRLHPRGSWSGCSYVVRNDDTIRSGGVFQALHLVSQQLVERAVKLGVLRPLNSQAEMVLEVCVGETAKGDRSLLERELLRFPVGLRASDGRPWAQRSIARRKGKG